NECVGPCKIDSLIFHGPLGAVRDSDTIKVVKCKGFADTIAGGSHVIEIAYFHEPGIIFGANQIDTLYFYKRGLIQMMNEVDTAVFYGNGDITGKNVFNRLTFTKGKKYLFESDSTQRIISRWTANGDCTGSIIIQSNQTGQEAFINVLNSQVELDYVSVRDIHAMGNQLPFIATNAVDLGNNTDWEFTQPAPLGLYWVNGQGNWDDPYHWAAYSGGPGNYCVPKEIDNVYFDENSFNVNGDTAFVNVDNAVCLSMYWQGSEIWEPVFFSEDTIALTIYGSLFLNDGMNNRFGGTVHFEEIGTKAGGKSASDTIQTFNKSFLNNVYFQGINGGWEMISDFSCNMNIFLKHGHLKTGENTVSCSRFISDTENFRILDISNSTISMFVINYDAWYANGLNLTLIADNSLLIADGFACNITNENGETMVFNDIEVNGVTAIVRNIANTVEYNNIVVNGVNCRVQGNYKVNDVRFYGDNGTLADFSETDLVIFYGTNGTIDGNHMINRAIFYAKGTIFKSSYFHEATFFANGNILAGENTFDILTFSPGGTYILQSNKDQTIVEELNIRGNNCFGILIESVTPGIKANLFMEAGTVVGDFLELTDINAYGGAEFYAGINSILVNTTGWIHNNAPGYIFGFGEDIPRFCLGTEYEITTENFNGSNYTEYFWNGSAVPGEPSLIITQPGTFPLTVDYGGGCYVWDTITVEADYPPVVNIDEGPYCEGDVVGLDIYPRDPYYKIKWFDETEDPFLIATLDNSGEVSVQVTDTVTGCITTDQQIIEVIETPKPEPYLGQDTTLIFGQTITLDAGPGSEFEWFTDDPLVTIPNPDQQLIEAIGTQIGVTYSVDVWDNGCKGSGSIFVGEF
ncbi:MAG: hypothetical protein K8R53_08555, partial [Bacteroidales bacterium]|nr:hypothetical protein [Bacteroidales bacterium]